MFLSKILLFRLICKVDKYEKKKKRRKTQRSVMCAWFFLLCVVWLCDECVDVFVCDYYDMRTSMCRMNECMNEFYCFGLDHGLRLLYP